MPAPTRRFLAALVLALLAVVVPVTAGGTALAGPAFPGPGVVAPTVVGTGTDAESTVTVPDPEPAAAGPHATPTGRAAVVGAPDSPANDTSVPPGPVLDVLLPALPILSGPEVSAPDDPVPGPDPGHDALADSRGPPAV